MTQGQKIAAGTVELYRQEKALILMRQREINAIHNIDNQDLTVSSRMAAVEAIRQRYAPKFQAIATVLDWLKEHDVFGKPEPEGEAGNGK